MSKENPAITALRVEIIKKYQLVGQAQLQFRLLMDELVDMNKSMAELVEAEKAKAEPAPEAPPATEPTPQAPQGEEEPADEQS